MTTEERQEQLDKCPIRPEHINTDKHFFDGFGNMETEVSANWLICFFQKRGTWSPFTYKEIDTFYAKKHKGGFTFNRLIDTYRKYIVTGSDEAPTHTILKTALLWPTIKFISACYKASPAA